MDSKIRSLTEKSRQVLLDCALENGAIITANTDKEYYPSNVSNYRYVWPRDAAFIIYAGEMVGINHIKSDFVNWLLDRAEGFRESGMIFQRYATNGLRDTEFGFQYQPDQSGAMLWSLCCGERTDDNIKRAVSLIADSLCSNWNGKCFAQLNHDCWEERKAFARMNDNFTYSLAACSFGLKMAYSRLHDEKWQRVSGQMDKVLKGYKGKYFPRLIGKLNDERIDASVMGLVWPFEVNDKRKINSINIIKKKLMTKEGLLRYEGDDYDTRIEHLNHWKKGSGGWPLLTFWLVVVLSKLGNKGEARKLFKSYISRFNDYMPEQVFGNDIQKSVTALAWSHAMFIIAANELGLLG